ncbi:GNAT family N-acetyltransferase [Pseudalkalibacillus decolorationis]|uniref:GNAT family N-acetyltransferase n=1 Tax=Pseudalkalibacillus decolorationis TaxID=163879 RepID=UPI00214725D3|nr:GNAT family N-acetyltransferase [Pseudalkalibacillus decolorationis]
MQKTISFIPVDYERDLELIYKWMHEPHVIPYWQLNMPFSKFEVHLKRALDDQHQTLYLGYMDGVPMSYWEAYWVNGDVVEKCYEPEMKDQGIHLLIGEADFLGKGYSQQVLEAMVEFQFRESETQKVIAEPDIRNDKMIHVFEKCGFKAIKPIKLPDKTGLLMFCDRERFGRMRKNDRTKSRTGSHL